MSGRLDADEAALLEEGLYGLALAGAEGGEPKTLPQNDVEVGFHCGIHAQSLSQLLLLSIHHEQALSGNLAHETGYLPAIRTLEMTSARRTP